MKIALAQINPTVGDFTGNTRKILEYAARAAEQEVGLVVFPELAVCGYPPADFLEKTAFVERAVRAVEEIAAWTSEPGRPALLVGSVMPAASHVGKRVSNVAVLLSGGKTVFVQQKMLLPFYDVFDEQRYFEPATSQCLTFVGDQPVAITICEDAWNDKDFWPRQLYPIDPVNALMQQWLADATRLDRHPRLILNISASPFSQGKPAVRQRMLAAIAQRHRAFVLLVNQVGGNDGLVFDGSSLLLDPTGAVVARAGCFTEDLVVFDLAATTEAAPAPCGEIVEVWQALVLGTRDYVRKCGFTKVLIGLSGGIDSALVAAIAVEALGAENVVGIGMPSEYSSLGSIDDARKLAHNLGIRFELLPIHDVFAQFQKVLEPLFAGTPFGLAEENLQSRIRGSLLMAMSNKFGALVLTTGNKSEMSVGYCTLYGDMVGALAVIGDVYKTRVYQLARYANRSAEIIPRNTIEKPPSAELRPDQRDTDSLPPYEVLDPILMEYVEHFLSAEQIARQQNLDLTLVRSVLKLVEQSEYKRQQAAPVLKVTQKSFGIGRRFPIAVKVQV
ncbi:NAD+ synthase [Edaphobacter modestus]|uniref:Glutamine-dependent NAD(+) synthetase n=1 Tax=Edaphobacter modestus TaxID=388466 RepID=A0A4Q7Z1B4_9BACT|nr:NAD+ synthase [Edaphobacter modestus]RZU43333.1 NAD+ synthase (glutamine-hydrolysing) [Edaphobacter modestus]